jgi:hypothetical protein
MALSNSISEDDLAAVLAFQMEEIAAATSDCTSSSDWDLAKSLLESELTQQLQIWEDHALAASMYRAAALDGEIIEEELSRAAQIQRDHEMALHLERSGAETFDQPPPAKRRRTALRLDPDVEEIYNRYMGSLAAVCWKDRGTGVGSSASAKALQLFNKNRLADCDVCTETKDDFLVVPLDCGHNHCLDCLRMYFLHSLGRPDEAFYIPRCCNETPQIPLWYAAEVLSETELTEYHRKLGTVNPDQKLKCSNVSCDVTIHPSWTKYDLALCMVCFQETCTICQRPAHRGECPSDEATTQLLEIAQRNHWQRCYSCGAMVQLQAGCYHITCRCRAEFCYICGANWKTCNCAHFEEATLLDGRPRTAGTLSLRHPTNFTTQLATISREIRTQVERNSVDHSNQLAALQALRAERMADREIVIAEKQVRDEEEREKEAYRQEQLRAQRKREREEIRVTGMRIAVEKKLKVCSDKALSKRKGKGKARDNDDDGLSAIANRVVEYALVSFWIPMGE